MEKERVEVKDPMCVRERVEGWGESEIEQSRQS